MSRVYCGGKPILPNKSFKFGTMKECAERKRIGRYGLLKVDKRMVSEAVSILQKKKGGLPSSKSGLLIEYSKTNGKLKKLEREFEAENKKKNKDETKIKELNKEITKITKVKNQIIDLIKNIEKKKTEKKIIIKKPVKKPVKMKTTEGRKMKKADD
jgi:hypothetical protein